MRFVVDESTGAAVVKFLRDASHDVLFIGEIMPQADDSDILSRAAGEGRILITNDKDFGEMVFRSGQGHEGVLLLRLHDESSARRIKIVEVVLNRYADRLAGHFVVATEGSVRIRPAQ